MNNVLKTIQVDRIANMMLAANEDGTAAIAVIDDMPDTWTRWIWAMQAL